MTIHGTDAGIGGHLDILLGNLRSKIQEIICYSVTVSKLDSEEPEPEPEPFVPLKAVEVYFSENQNQRLSSILNALYDPEEPPIYPEAILKRYTAVFCILLDIGRANLIHLFTKHDALRDQYLPFDQTNIPSKFPKSSEQENFYQEFCQNQWRYTIPSFRRPLDERFVPQQILPIVSRELLPSSKFKCDLWKVTIHEDYNFLHTEKEERGISSNNKFALKSYSSSSEHDMAMYDAEVKAFKQLGSAQGILGYYGTYVQDNTSNILLEYVDQGSLDEYLKKVAPPVNGWDIINFWQQIFIVIKALAAIHKIPSNDIPSEPSVSLGWCPDIQPSNILVASYGASSPYKWKFQLANLVSNKTGAKKAPIDNISNENQHYDSPELAGHHHIPLSMKERNSCDIWSLGCVFSEVATWMVSGYDGMLHYQHQRGIENDAEHNHVPRRSFHDGQKVLEVVQEHHKRLSNQLRSDDFVTQSVLDLMVEEMLEVPAGRPTADQLLVKSERVLSKAEYRYAALKTIPPRNDNVPTKPVILRSPSSANEIPRLKTGEAFPVRNSNLHLQSTVGEEIHGQELESITPVDDFVNKPEHNNTEHEYLDSVDQISSHQLPDTVNTELAKSTLPPTPRLLVSGSDGCSFSAEQEHDSIFGGRTGSPRRPRSDGRHVSEAPLSVSDVLDWKVRRKTRRGAIDPLFDPQSLNRLGERDHIFIIDDSNSMSLYWNEVQNTLEALTYILKSVDPDGIDVSFATSKYRLKGVRSTTKLLKFLEQGHMKLNSEKRRMDINSSVGLILKEYGNAMREPRAGSAKRPRPFTLYVLTDGIWKGDEHIDTQLMVLGKDLNHLHVNDWRSGVQFITFGDDPVGLRHLDQLDTELRGCNFDVTPSQESVRRMLFGVGDDQGSEEKGRPKRRLPALKNGIRRITTLSVRSGPVETRTESIHAIKQAAALQLKPRTRRSVHGLFEWTNPPQPALDVLFVHGLDGDREKDWIIHNHNSSSQTNWPKDLMYPRFRDIRILTYGYDSAPWYSSYPIKDVITSQARVLIETLVKVRVSTPDRPLIIVAHGTGSLLVKSALLQSHLSLDSDTTKERGIKLSTTGLILLNPPDVQISGEFIVPAVLESHLVGETGKEARKSTPKDLIWLKLQMESFQSISESFSIIHFHTCKKPHQPYRPFLPTTISTDLLEEPKDISDSFESTNRSRFTKSFEVERVNDFGSEEDQDYQVIIQVFEDLYNKASDESKFHWSNYAMDKVSAQSNETGFNSSELIEIRPPRNDRFTGRHTALDSLRAGLFDVDNSKQSRGTPSTVEIYGSAGIGKTQLALEFIHRYSHKFSTILWIDAQNRVSVERAFCKIERRLSRSRNANVETTQASRLNISSSSESTSSSTESARSSNLARHSERQALTSCSTDLVRAWLAKENNSQWIIVFDGADDEQKSWIQGFFPNTKNGHILLTTRHRGLLKDSTSIHLDRMSEEDAIKLLLYYCPHTHQSTAIELVRRLDYVPLAITQAGNYMASTNLSPSEYLNRFRGAIHRDWDNYATRMKMVFSTSVNEVFETSYQEVKAKDHDALDLLNLCSYLAAENIPGLVLEAISKRSGLRLEDMVDTLFNNGFGHREENLQSFRMHTLVQSWLRRRHPPHKQQAIVSKVLTGLATFVELWRMRDEKTLQGVEKLLVKHIIACLNRVEDIKQCNVSWCVLGQFCKQDKRYNEATKLFEMGLSDPEIIKKKGCSDRQRLGFELGSLYQRQGRSNDAVEKYEEILKECDQSPPDEDDEDSKHLRGQLLLDIYKSLSSVYTRIGRTQQSIKILNDGVAKFKKLFGPNNFQTLQLLDICAAEYYDQEDYAQAEQLTLWIVSAQTQTLGVDHPATIHAQERLARVYFQRSKFREAEELSRHCLVALERSLGSRHPATIHQLTFLGRVCTKSHKFPEAEELLNRAVQGACEALGLQHPETLNAREELAMCYEAQGSQAKLEQAHATYLQVMFGREDAKDPGIRRTLERLLPLMEQLGMQDEARQLTVQWSNGFDGAV